MRDASFSIQEGEIFGFLGPNGAGKTTTIACIAGLLARWKGEILFHERRFSPASSPEDRLRLGLVPQDLALYQDLSARENLEFFGRLDGLSGSELAQAVERALALAGLEDRAGDRVDAFSGGMKRRLNLAIGDLHRPELLLLDEPTAGVDPQSRNHLFETLHAICGAGRTLLYTTHYMEEAERLCDRVGILNDGVLVGIGTPGELAVEAGIPGRNLEEVFLKMTGRTLRDP